MAGWTHHDGQAIALPLDNVDTDQLIPARFMSIPRAQGYGGHLLYDLRRDETGDLRSDFPVNRWPNASILIAGRNFGCGSSREAAVYALVDAGFRAVIAPGFGDIFAGNAVNNGLLPAQVETDMVAALTAAAPGTAQIDLENRRIVMGDVQAEFALGDAARTKLINGWDDIDLTRAEAESIAAYRAARAQSAPWFWPG